STRRAHVEPCEIVQCTGARLFGSPQCFESELAPGSLCRLREVALCENRNLDVERWARGFQELGTQFRIGALLTNFFGELEGSYELVQRAIGQPATVQRPRQSERSSELARRHVQRTEHLHGFPVVGFGLG